MEIETFEQTEQTATGEEKAHDEQALKLIEELDLKGQKGMTAGDGIVRVPYRAMNELERRVYETLYPQKTKIENYKDSMIPLRVLQVASHAKSLGFYKEIQVWGETVKAVDPILVGVAPDPEMSWSSDFHILARWGNALDSFENLYEKAIKVLARRFSSDARIAKAEADRVIATSEATAIGYLEDGRQPMYR